MFGEFLLLRQLNTKTQKISEKLTWEQSSIKLLEIYKKYFVYIPIKIIKYASGKYIAFFDDDDVSNINRLKFQYQRIEDYKNRKK